MIGISFIDKDKVERTILSSINSLRFPLILGVVFLHTFVIDEGLLGRVPYPHGEFPILEGFEYLLKTGIGDLCVACFFVISGYLFFRSGSLNREDYTRKLKSRLHTLFIPYIFWNTAFILFVTIVGLVFPSLAGDRRSVFTFELNDWLNAYWDLSLGLIPLWYIRDLMIINLFAPLIYFLIKKMRGIFLLILFVMWFFYIGIYINGIGLRASMFYCLGAYVAIEKPKIPALNGLWLIIITIPYIVLMIARYMLHIRQDDDIYLWQASVFYGVVIMLLTVLSIHNRYEIKTSKLLLRNCFFIYVFHMFVIYIPDKLMLWAFPTSTFWGIIILGLVPIVTIMMCICVYETLRKVSPTFCRFISGER